MTEPYLSMLFLFWAVSLMITILMVFRPIIGILADYSVPQWQGSIAEMGLVNYFNAAVQPLLGAMAGALFGVAVARIADDPTKGITDWGAVTTMALGLVAIIASPVLYVTYRREYHKSWALPFKVAALESTPDVSRIEAVTAEISNELLKVRTKPGRLYWTMLCGPPFIAVLSAVIWYGVLDAAGADFGRAYAALGFLALLLALPLVLPFVSHWLERRRRTLVTEHLQRLEERMLMIAVNNPKA